MTISDRTKIHPEDSAELVREGEELEAFARSLGAEIYGVARMRLSKNFLKSLILVSSSQTLSQ